MADQRRRPQTPAPAAPLSSDGRPDFLVKLGLLLPCSPEDVKQAYLAKAKLAHPDAGGNAQQFIELQTAYERALEFTRFHAGRSRWLADSVERYIEQEQVVAEIQARGGAVELEHTDWLKNEIGEDFAQMLDTVAGVRFNGPEVGDETIDFLVSRKRCLRSLYWIDLRRSRVTDDGLLKLAAFPTLRKLDLRGTRIGNKGLKLVWALERLDWLGLAETKVNWFGRWRLRRWRPQIVLAAT
jgi:Leucine Rich repeat